MRSHVQRALYFLSIILINKAFGAPGLSAPDPKGNSPLLNSYLPAAMQVLAHLTNQMKFVREEPVTSKPVASSTTTQSPTPAQTTSKPELTTESHKPAIFAPVIPPNPDDYRSEDAILPIVPETPDYQQPVLLPGYQPYSQNLPIFVAQQEQPVEFVKPLESFPLLYQPSAFDKDTVYLPGEYNSEYPAIARSGDVVLTDDTIPDISSLPVENENNFKYNPLIIEPEELSDDNLQYISQGAKDILINLKSADPAEKWTPEMSFQSIEDLFSEDFDRKDVSDWLRLKKAPPTRSLIQMLLLYDLLSRDAKAQKLNNYHGFTNELLEDLAETSKGTAAEQLKTILERMVARGDCRNDFANNRAKEMAKELENSESSFSREIRYIEPLRYAD